MNQTVTLEDREWQQLVAILAQSTGYLAMQKLFAQLQSQSQQEAPEGVSHFTTSRPGDGLDMEPEPRHAQERRVPRA